ncbi:hypothetical protein EJB05_13538, partial [Eragrostis curvula]
RHHSAPPLLVAVVPSLLRRGVVIHPDLAPTSPSVGKRFSGRIARFRSAESSSFVDPSGTRRVLRLTDAWPNADWSRVCEKWEASNL